MNFFKTVQKSIYSREFYQDIVEKPFSFSLKYFYLLITLLATILFAVYASIDGGAILSFASNLPERLLSYYPGDLIITIKDGSASTNVSEPYFIKIPEGLSTKEAKNLLAIDTKNSFSYERFIAYDTLFLLSKDAFVSISDKGEIRVIPLAKIPDAKIDHALVASFIGKFQPYIKIFLALLALLAFLGLLAFYSSNLLYLLLAALLIWGIAKTRNLPFGYKKSYQIGLHAITLPLILYTCMLIVAPLWVVNFCFTLVLLFMVWINMH